MRALYSLLVLAAVTALPGLAFAAEETASSNGWGLGIGAGLAIGLAVLGGGIGQGLTAGNAAAGVARNPGASGNILTQMVIGLAFIESIALIAFIVAYTLSGKI